ncbi:hypothetical protein WN944_010476 [Citrus x changshan-huyou]|uniref:Uncharacterized protein n=1 Tax=Citrus x changshan-huyou TaxID=2935761 RepID=A0AAP0MRP7_9ROSI
MGDETILGGHPFTAGELIDLSEEELQIAHRYVLYNSAEDRIDIDSMMKNSRDIRLDRNETSHKRKCSEDTSHAKKSKTCGSTFTNIENARCRLLDWMGTGKVVGEGTIASRDPLAKVHHICLGPDC